MATVAELRATAKAKGLKGYNKLNKQQLEGIIIRYNLEMQKAETSTQATIEQQEQPKAQKPKNADEAQELLKSAETAEQITAILQNCTKHILWKLADRECIHYEDFSKAPIYITKPEMIRDMTKIFVKRLNAIHAEKECKIRIHAANRPYITFNGSTRLINAWSLNYLDSKRKSTPEQIAAFLASVEKLETKHKAMKAQAPASTPEAFTINPDLVPNYDAAFDETAYTPDVKNVSVIVDDIPADHEPDIQPLQTNKPDSQPAAPAKFIIGRHYQSRGLDKGTVTFLGKVSRDCGYFVDSLNCYHRVKIKTDSTGEYASISHKCGSFPADRISAAHEVLEHEIISVANGTSILLDAENVIHSYQELEAKLATKPAPSEPERQQEIIARRQHKAKAEARRNTTKPATKKPRHAKKIDESRQVLIQFDEPETHAPASTPAKPKVRRTRKPRIKKDYSRQILIDFGENIPDGQTNQRKAA